jgi:hypothetical protein
MKITDTVYNVNGNYGGYYDNIDDTPQWEYPSVNERGYNNVDVGFNKRMLLPGRSMNHKNNYNFIDERYQEHMSREMFHYRASVNDGYTGTVNLEFYIDGVLPADGYRSLYAGPCVIIYVKMRQTNYFSSFDIFNRCRNGARFRDIYSSKFINFLRYNGLTIKDECIIISTNVCDRDHCMHIDSILLGGGGTNIPPTSYNLIPPSGSISDYSRYLTGYQTY